MVTGLLLILLAGVMNGTFPLPMRYMRKWAWENIWIVYSIVAWLIVPWLLAWLTVPHLGAVYERAGSKAIISIALIGLLGGIPGFLFGISVELVGMSLTFAVVNGLSAAIGSLVPLMALHPGKIFTAGGLIVSSGILCVVAGVSICSWAGHLRSRSSDATTSEQRPGWKKTGFWRGLTITVITGVLAPSLNIAIAFGQKISSAALMEGASPEAAVNAVLAVFLTGGFITIITYCLYRLARNRTTELFRIPETKKYFLLGTVMGLLWILSYSIYGSSISYLGQYGTIVGWPILAATITIVSSLYDVAYGDWAKDPLRIMALGVVLLIGAVSVISYGQFRLQHGF